MSQPVKLMWFRGDLRLTDNPALHAVCAAGGPVALLYVLDERAGAASRWWLHHSLSALAQDIESLGGHLILRQGDPLTIIPALATEIGAGAVHVARAFEPAHRALDRALDTALKSRGIALHRHHSLSLFPPERIVTKAGTPYGVFTPFSKACLAAGVPEEVCPRPARIQGVPAPSDDLASWALLPTHPDWAGGLRAAWQPGEAGARHNLAAFLAGPIQAYSTARDLPGHPGTSKLSPHIHFGEISPRQLWHSAASQGESKGGATYLKELLWREFSLHLLWQHPNIRTCPIRPEFERFPWHADTATLRAWQRGRTGVPIVDAGMRQLWQTGWMHNRVRMICASYLVKHLLIPWQSGEAWFWDTLVDADEAANGASWQWVAGCGADAAPYFRIFNPVLQGQKFDPEGTYIRRFVPELAKLPAACVHAPWLAPPALLAAAGVRLGTTYPRPLADLAEGRARALAAFATLKV
ncbi:deoxyribodipyrimidine photo-lyase [Acidocella sp.]|uniref:cryptochrome/photolyase family protein n=1 Tax=Acidocella sp. TaxID=50710 RepID=UPI00261227DF|nr:deoxyribodipyrimidine photo-lyase [Acidocella sp.]